MPSKLFDLSDRTCLVTGSARRLGNALAEGLAEAGATVVLNSLNPERCPRRLRLCVRRVTSAFLVGRETARRMIERGRGGKIINIGSLTSEAARATTAPYTVAKGGIKLLTRAMTAEWAEHGIQINTIGPGYMITEMTKSLAETPSFDAWVLDSIPESHQGKLQVIHEVNHCLTH